MAIECRNRYRADGLCDRCDGSERRETCRSWEPIPTPSAIDPLTGNLVGITAAMTTADDAPVQGHAAVLPDPRFVQRVLAHGGGVAPPPRLDSERSGRRALA